MGKIDYAGWIKRGLDKESRSQAQLARHIGIHPTQMTRVMQGKRQLRANEIEAVASYLKIDLPGHEFTVEPVSARVGGRHGGRCHKSRPMEQSSDRS